MLALGIHGSYKRIDEENRFGYSRHESTAVLLRNGEVLAAIEEERLNRVKHSNCFPVRAIKYCLDQQGLGLKDVDLIATNNEYTNVGMQAKNTFLEESDRPIVRNGQDFYASLFQREFGV